MKILRDYLLEIILAIISFSLLLLLLLPYFSGYKIQTDYSDALTTLSKSAGLSLETVSYQRNWFSSNARLIAKNSRQEIVFEVIQEIVHGPLYLGLILQGRSPVVNMVVKGHFIMAEPVQGSEQYAVFLSSLSPVTLSAYMDYDGDAVISLQASGNTTKKEDSSQFQIKTVSLDMEYTASSDQLEGELIIPELSFYGKQFVELENLMFGFEQVFLANKSGDMVLSFSSLKFKHLQRIVDLRKVSARIKRSVNAGLHDLGFDLNVSKLNVFNEQVNNLSLRMLVSGLDLTGVSFFTRESNLASSLKDQMFSLIRIKPFSFFSEHGAMRSELSLTTEVDQVSDNEEFWSNKSLSLNAELTPAVFRRIYELSSDYSESEKNSFDVFKNRLYKLNYIDNSLGKVKINISGKNKNFVVNNHSLSYEKLSNTLESSVFRN